MNCLCVCVWGGGGGGGDKKGVGWEGQGANKKEQSASGYECTTQGGDTNDTDDASQ